MTLAVVHYHENVIHGLERCLRRTFFRPKLPDPKRDNRLLSNLASCIASEATVISPLENPSRGEWQLKILVIIPGDVYDGFLDTCPVTSGQYQTLKNGVVINDPQYGKAIEILCEPIYAQVLLGLARAIYPDAAPYIEESIRLAREP